MGDKKSTPKFGEIRNSLKYHRDSAKKQPGWYGADTGQVANYFKHNPEYRKKILTYFSKLREDEIPIVHLDICGVATVQSLGGDMSYCFSLKDQTETDWNGNRIIQGDLFSNRDFAQFLDEVKSGEAPALITFRPIAGLQDNNPYISTRAEFRESTEGILAKRFSQCANVLRRWGYMYLERPFQFDSSLADFLSGVPQEEYELSRQIKTLSKNNHCNIKIEGSIYGPKFLIRKRRG